MRVSILTVSEAAELLRLIKRTRGLETKTGSGLCYFGNKNECTDGEQSSIATEAGTEKVWVRMKSLLSRS